MTEQRHRLLEDLLTRNDGWPDSRENETALEYDYMKRHLTMTVIFLSWNFVAVIVGSIGNIFIIGAVITYKRLSRNPTNIFILNLAVADLGVAAITNPVHIANVMIGPRIYYGRENLCYVFASQCANSCHGSMLFISAIAINRYICICKPLSYQSLFSRKKTILYCILIWIITGLIDMPNWIGWSVYTFRLKEMLCGVDERGDGGYVYMIFRSVMSLGFPVTIVCICYLSIYRHVRKSKAALQKFHRGYVSNGGSGEEKDTNIHPVKKEDIQLAITLFATFVIFMVLWSPYMITTAVDTENVGPKELYLVAVVMGHANSVFNCFTYGVCNSNFRKGYYAFLLSICRRKTNDAYKDKTSVQKCYTIDTVDK